MLEILSIPYQHTGTGFNNDYGDFSYELYKPPSNLKTHHQLLVDFLIVAKDFRDELNTLENNDRQIDFRDNRYASRKYKLTIKKEGVQHHQKTFTFRPDAELRINSKTFFVEIDLGTERKTHLTDKFEGYRKYFEFLKSRKEPLPAAIIFISEEMFTEAQKDRRWQTISGAFLETLGEYSTTVNLIYESIDKAQDIISGELNSIPTLKQVIRNIQNLDSPGNITLRDIPFQWGNTRVAIPKDPTIVFPLVRVEGYETMGWAVLWRFNESIKKQGNNGKIKGTRPIIYYSTTPPKPISYFKKNDKERYFDSRLHFKTRGTTGKWQDKNLKEYTSNPFKK